MTSLVALENTLADFQLFGVTVRRVGCDGDLTAGLEQDLDSGTWTLILYPDVPLPVLEKHVEQLWQAFLNSDDCGQWWVEPAGACDGCDEHPLGHEWGPRRCIGMGLGDDGSVE
ncbi:hypothetical protein DBB34_14595 [Sphaerisporangium cinnabarinum]|nr:hypothetical protein [Sphaerisporangium cinnabarinum]PTU55382.1 hypothetical protein DBB34_14595 [Sphaerisporangium cinnabarinum]